MNDALKPWRRLSNSAKKRISYLEIRLKDPLDKEIEDLMDQLLLFPDGAAIIERAMEKVEHEKLEHPPTYP